jgi:hypothetical protein
MINACPECSEWAYPECSEWAYPECSEREAISTL